jgi:hypothetical protein
MKFPDWLPVYGSLEFRGQCPPEHVEQASFFARLRREYPDTWGKIALHPRNEGLLIKGQFQSVVRHQLEGMAKGAADIVIPGGRGGFVCELKRRDHTKSAWQDGQTAYLKASKDAGAFVCVALGAAAAWMAFQEWLGD